jgi:hypothetical protein
MLGLKTFFSVVVFFVTSSAHSTRVDKLCEWLLSSSTSNLTSALIKHGYERSIAERIVRHRPHLANKILSGPMGQPGYVTRGICISPTDFDPKFSTNGIIYVKAENFSAKHQIAFTCPGGIAIEMQIPQFEFEGWNSETYQEAFGHWGYLSSESIGDLSDFITRVEITPLNPTELTIRMTHSEFTSLVDQMRFSGKLYSANYDHQRRGGKLVK